MKQKKTNAPKKRVLVMGLDLSALSKYDRQNFREYTPARGSELIWIMAEGRPLAVAAEKMGIGVPTIHEWANKYPEFAEALKRAEGLYLFYLETQLLAARDTSTVNAAIRELKRTCPEEWGDKDKAQKNAPANRLHLGGALRPHDCNAATDEDRKDKRRF